jgi:hypothetical protein
VNKTLEILTQLTGVFVQANVAAPIISGSIMAIAAIIKGITGTGPTLLELADMLEQKLGANDANIRAEIARMEALTAPKV